jgi:outer membrane protein assembly factor BamB
LLQDGLSTGPGWVPEGKLVWTREVGLGYSSPSIARGRLYVHGFDAERQVDVLRCLQTQNGLELWAREWPARSFAQDHEGGTLTTPAVDGEHVFVSEREGTIACYQSGTGRLVWHKDLSLLLDVDPGMYGFSGSPLVLGELVIVHANRVVALAKQSGDLAWVTGELQAVYSTPLAFTLAGETRLASFGQLALSLLDPADGGVLAAFPWQKDPRVVCCASPVVVGERLFVSSAYEHGCALLDFSGGAARAVWENRSMRSKMAGCVLVDGYLYGFDESLLKCLDLEGNERWRVRGLGNGALSGGDGKLAILSSRGELIVAQASPEAFRELAREKLFEDGVCWTPPVIADGFLYCRNNHGTLVCRDHRTAAPSAADPGGPAPSATPSEALPAASDLLARHLELVGGREAVLGLRSLRVSGRYENRSQGFVPVPFESVWLAPDRLIVLIEDVPPRRIVHRRVCDGGRAYRLDPRGELEPYPEARQRELCDAADLHAVADPTRSYRVLRTTGLVTFAERPCYRVEAETAGGSRRWLYFDAASGFLAGREGEHEALVILDDYREFGGLWLATRERSFDPEGGIEELFRTETVELDTVDPARFEQLLDPARPPRPRPQ